ncbi:hypothetical protein D4R99_00365 [bacterium]|nr:MAG: hypothetical protein D4R99_00365 [bacterium]
MKKFKSVFTERSIVRRYCAGDSFSSRSFVARLFPFAVLLFTAFLFFSCESNDGPIAVNKNINLKSNSKSLVEFFTNTSCVACPPPGHFLDLIDSLQGITINDTNVIIIRYHTAVFANDPYYLHNTLDNQGRCDYYYAPNTYNPVTYLMGQALPSYSFSVWQSLFNTQLATINDFGIDIVITYNPVSRTGTADIDFGQLTGQSISDLKMHVALTESEILYAAPNGESVHQNTLRKLLTGPSGQSVSIQPGQTQSFSFNFSVDNIINAANCDIVVFVQSDAGQIVYGVEKKRLP